MTFGITILIPTIPPRSDSLILAQASVALQTRGPVGTIVELDEDHSGSAATRNRALARVKTEWIVWLDDDDLLMPNALQLLAEAQEATSADVVSGAAWIPQTPGHREPTAPLPSGWVAGELVKASSRLTVTALMRTEQVRQVGGFEFRRDPSSNMDLDDYGLYWKLADAGATFWRIPETVFIWNVHGANTSGHW